MITLYGCQTEDSTNNRGKIPIITPDNNPYDWAIQYTETYVDLTDVYFIDNMTGWIVGEENTILSTTMGGNTWPQAPVNSYDGNFRSVIVISENIGWISGDMNGNAVNGNIYISSSGGSYPESQKLSEYPLNAVFGLNESLVWSGGENGQLLYSEDGGQNWIESSTDFIFSISDIYFIDENEGYAVGENGKIIKSTDGGINWELNHEIPEIDFTSVHFIDASTG
ncbi:MAG: YCF48-related protein, partial [Cyclobacteriaceae bacterium]